MILSTARRKQRILIVDNQPESVRSMTDALNNAYDLFFAATGSNALEHVAGGEIDLVLLDVTLPDTDGFEVCRRIKANERSKHLPVIFVTERKDVEEEVKGFSVGGVDYITKPIQPEIVGARVRTHLELKQARDLLEQMASNDPLTGIANRRRLESTAEYEWPRAVRGGQWISLAIIDVDHFKQYNDTYGHSKGDACLQMIARGLMHAVRRPGDLVARYGGEEFAIIVPDTDATGMRRLMAILLGRIADLAIPHSASDAGEHVTISIGAVSLIPNPRQTAAVAIETADKLLYEVKEGGRNHCMHLNFANGIRQRIDAPTVILPS